MSGQNTAVQDKGTSIQKTSIPMDRLGAEIDQRYGAQGSGPVATDTGYKLAAKMQALEAEVTPAGLTVTSLAKKEGAGQFFNRAGCAQRQGARDRRKRNNPH